MTGLFLRGEVCDNSAEGGDDDDTKIPRHHRP